MIAPLPGLVALVPRAATQRDRGSARARDEIPHCLGDADAIRIGERPLRGGEVHE